jgi:hypothetical protein
MWLQAFGLSIDGNNASQVSDNESIGQFDLFLKMVNYGKDAIVVEDDAVHALVISSQAKVAHPRDHRKSVFRSVNPYAQTPAAGDSPREAHTEETDESNTASSGVTPRRLPDVEAPADADNPGTVHDAAELD